MFDRQTAIRLSGMSEKAYIRSFNVMQNGIGIKYVSLLPFLFCVLCVNDLYVELCVWLLCSIVGIRLILGNWVYSSDALGLFRLFRKD